MIEIINDIEKLEAALNTCRRLMRSQIPSNGIAVRNDPKSPVHKAVADVKVTLESLWARLEGWR